MLLIYRLDTIRQSFAGASFRSIIVCLPIATSNGRARSVRSRSRDRSGGRSLLRKAGDRRLASRSRSADRAGSARLRPAAVPLQHWCEGVRGGRRQGGGPGPETPSVKIHGKSGKQRYCPLWTATVVELRALVADGAPSRSVFLNRCGQPITRFGTHTAVERYGLKVVAKMPSLATKRVSPHSIRHTTATHLLRADVDINTVRGWLGPVKLDRDQPALMDFLRSL